MKEENIDTEEINELAENDFGCILYKLEQLNNSFPYYKTMIMED